MLSCVDSPKKLDKKHITVRLRKKSGDHYSYYLDYNKDGNRFTITLPFSYAGPRKNKEMSKKAEEYSRIYEECYRVFGHRTSLAEFVASSSCISDYRRKEILNILNQIGDMRYPECNEKKVIAFHCRVYAHLKKTRTQRFWKAVCGIIVNEYKINDFEEPVEFTTQALIKFFKSPVKNLENEQTFLMQGQNLGLGA